MELKYLLNRASRIPIGRISELWQSVTTQTQAGYCGLIANPLKLSFLKNQPLGSVTDTFSQTEDVLMGWIAAQSAAEGPVQVTTYPV